MSGTPARSGRDTAGTPAMLLRQEVDVDLVSPALHEFAQFVADFMITALLVHSVDH